MTNVTIALYSNPFFASMIRKLFFRSILLAGIFGAQSVFAQPDKPKWKFYPWSEKSGKDEGAKVKVREPSSLPVQLYDTDADITKTLNLADQFPEVVKRLRAAYNKTMANVEVSSKNYGQNGPASGFIFGKSSGEKTIGRCAQ